MKATCPKCGQPLAAEEINVSADRAMCRNCNELFNLGELIDVADAFVPLHQPPRGVQVDDLGGTPSVVVSLRKLAAIFLIFFTAIWSGVSMSGMVMMIVEQGFSLQLLFFLPFFLGTLVLLSLIALFLFGRSDARVNDGQLTLFTGVGPLGYRRMVDLSQVDRIWMDYGGTRVNHQPVKEIFIGRGPDQKPLKFGVMMKEEQKAYILTWLREQLRRHHRGGRSGSTTGPRAMTDIM